MSGYYQNTDPGDGTGDDSPSGSKRKRDGGGGIQHRTKRNRYISIACNECKRRKIKCNGQTPCQRCGNLNLDCVYSPNCCSNNFRDSLEFKELTSQVNSLQDQVNNILHNLNSLRSSLSQDDYQFGRDDSLQFRQDGLQPAIPMQSSLPIDPALQSRSLQHQSPQQSQHLPMDGSSSLTLDLSQQSLRNADISSAEEAIHQGILAQTDGQTQGSLATIPGLSNESGRDPIWLLSKDEALRLCEVFESDVAIMYPILDIDRLKRHATMLFKFIDAVSKTFMMNDKPGPDSIHDQDTDLLKLVFAVTLVVEGSGRSEFGRKLFDFVNKETNSRLLGNVNFKDIQILTLTALYHLYTDDESLARRMTGLTARLCLELRLHRAETYDSIFANDIERATARHLFWSIYILDHTWSLASDMSVAIQEADVDPQLARPADTSPYLDSMVGYSQLCDQVRKFTVLHDGSYGAAETERAIREFVPKIAQWQDQIPEQLRFIPVHSSEHFNYQADNDSNPNGAKGRAVHRQRSLLYLRANHLRICTYRTILNSGKNALSVQNASSEWAVQAAATSNDTIDVLYHLNFDTDLCHTRQTAYDTFLVEALATIFLVVAFAPVKSTTSEDFEFYKGLTLAQRLSAHSKASKRLSSIVRELKPLLSNLGIYPVTHDHSNEFKGAHNGISDTAMRSPSQPNRNQQNMTRDQNEAQRSAAMAMAGLAGHSVEDNVDFALDSQASASQELLGNASRNNGQWAEPEATNLDKMANDFKILFDAIKPPSKSSSGRALNDSEISRPERTDLRAKAAELNQLLKGL